jgi:hypothetical protein
MKRTWIVLSYTLPAEPSSKRVLVWRHLRKLGAMPDGGVWLLPRTPALDSEFRNALAEIQELGGRPLAFYAADLPTGQAEALQAAFNNLRRDEYSELLQRCQRFVSHVQRLTEAHDFKFGAVEELEEDLEKRRRSLAQIITRDAFEVGERQQVEACIDECAAALARFVAQAYLASESRPKS